MAKKAQPFYGRAWGRLTRLGQPHDYKLSPERHDEVFAYVQRIVRDRDEFHALVLMRRIEQWLDPQAEEEWQLFFERREPAKGGRPRKNDCSDDDVALFKAVNEEIHRQVRQHGTVNVTLAIEELRKQSEFRSQHPGSVGALRKRYHRTRKYLGLPDVAELRRRLAGSR